MANEIFEAYLTAGGGSVRKYFPEHFQDPEGRRRAVMCAAKRPIPAAVANALEAQNAHLVASAARDAALASLRGGAAAVVTGQQMGLFLGPLFTLYKAATAVRAAEALSVETGHPVVPIFWLQTEDHDLPEIATCAVPSASEKSAAAGACVLSLPASADDRRSVAQQVLPSELAQVRAQLRAELEILPHAAEHLAHLEAAYKDGAGWVDAFTELAAQVFVHTPLVFVDARRSELARFCSPVHRRAISEASQIADALEARAQELESAGLGAQVYVRSGAPLSFFHPDGPTGPRCRLDAAEGGFETVTAERRRFSADQLLSALERDPSCFSTSALLRPILQDTLLPTAAYVAGPGEIAYFAQLSPLYAHFGIEMPVIVPRARFRVVERKTARLAERLGVSLGDAAEPEDVILAKAKGVGPELPEADRLAASVMEPFDRALRAAVAAVQHLDPALEKARDKTHDSVERSVAKLFEKYERARLHRDEAQVEDVRRLKAALYPEGQPQERYYGVSYFAARYGERAFVDLVLSASDPFAAVKEDLSP